MTVIIDELIASVETPAHAADSGEAESRLSEDQQQQAMIDWLELTQERKTRLVID